VIAGLDRIQQAGADVIWLMPIHPIGVSNRKGTLGSPYAVVDYYAVNPDMGTRADFRELVRAVHARGMKLIIDWVPNHTAHDAVWTTAHPGFHVRDSAGRLTTPRDEKGNLTDWTDVAQLDYGNPALRQAMTSAMRYWLEEFGIDGFRMDVAGFVPDDFWREAVPALRRAVPRPILLLAEWGDPKMHRFGFDLTYGWDPYARLKEVWKGAPASGFVQKEVAEMQAWPRGGMRLRFTTNHDETAWDQPPVTLFGGPAGARAAQVATALLPGRPMLYNGQEVESPLKLRLFEKDTIDWNAPGLPAARAFYRRVMELSRTLRAADFAAVTTSAPDDVIAYRRGDAVVLVNPRPREVRFSVTGVPVDGTRDLLTDLAHAGTTVTLPAHGAMVLAPR
jgi:glycosidase